MAKFCVGCGKEISDGIAFCTECGTKVSEEEVSAPQTETVEEQPRVEAAPVAPTCAGCGTQRSGVPVHEPAKAANSASPQQQVHQMPAQELPPKGGKYGMVGTGTFFGLELLFMIPFIGWLACLIMAFAPENVNLKHYARAKLIWVLISIVLCIAAYFLIQWIGGVLLDYINQATDGMFTEWSDLFEQFKQFENAGIENLPLN